MAAADPAVDVGIPHQPDTFPRLLRVLSPSSRPHLGLLPVTDSFRFVCFLFVNSLFDSTQIFVPFCLGSDDNLGGYMMNIVLKLQSYLIYVVCNWKVV